MYWRTAFIIIISSREKNNRDIFPFFKKNEEKKPTTQTKHKTRSTVVVFCKNTPKNLPRSCSSFFSHFLQVYH